MPSPSLTIALRFASHRKRSIVLSLLGVILGVAFFIATQAHTSGFEKFYIETVLGTAGALRVSDRFQPRFSAIVAPGAADLVSVRGRKPRKYYEGITDPARVMQVIRSFSSVVACAPVLQGNATVETEFGSEIFRLQGIHLADHLAATALRDQVADGDLATFGQHPNGVVLGWLLARKLRAEVGDTVTLIGPGGDRRGFEVCALFRSGDNFIDEKHGFVDLRVAQSLLGKPSGVSFITVKLRDPDRAPALATHLERLLHHHARSWQEREQGTLTVFRAIRLSAALTVSTIILLAGFGIFNIFTLTVLDKAREIAVLRSMGYRRRDISAIFLWKGFLVATAGAALGCLLGAVITWAVSRIPVRIRGFFTLDYFVVDWAWHHYAVAIFIAYAAVFVASYFPARRAARLAPVAVLRGAGQ